MGWVYRYAYNTPKTYAEIKAEVIRLHTASEGAAVRYDVLQAAQVGSFWVVACKVTPLTAECAEGMRANANYVTAPDGSYTFASIIKTGWSEGDGVTKTWKRQAESTGIFQRLRRP